MRIKLLYISLAIILFSCSDSKDGTETFPLKLETISIDGKTSEGDLTEVNPNAPIILSFSDKLDANTIDKNIMIRRKGGENITSEKIYNGGKTVELKTASPLIVYTNYEVVVLPNLKSASGEKINTGKIYNISTGVDMTDKFERISDDELLTLVQKQTFNYFWEFAHPTSGMARERSTSSDVVTTGGTGFGVMAMLVASERGFITRQQATQRVQTIVSFLDTKCKKYHGAYAHWINGETGETRPFSAKDDGADLVETALLFQGLLTAKAYFNGASAEEVKLRQDITRLWEAIEWTWFQKDDNKTLYWHWSETQGWAMNLPISGWNESLIVYVLAAASPTHPISKEVYNNGWTRNGAMKNGKTYYGYELPLGTEKGGPLFLSQYSFLGINPNGLKDQYADYFIQNKNHTLINRAYCIENPKAYAGYSENCWGLTASDNDKGYSAHSPSNDLGTIAPTAALSAIPYTPEESMQALHFFYYKLGDRLWGKYGFYDAFNLSANWVDSQNIAIDQGPIIVMIENYRTGLLWKHFMSLPEIKDGLTKLGFESPQI